MRVAALYDIHGNLRALEAVLAEVEAYAPDRVLIGGDVALGPMPRATLELIATLGERVVYLRGNCDREMVAALGGAGRACVVHGHTHVQYQRTVGGTHWICPGSVGLPYEDEPGARWATFGPE